MGHGKLEMPDPHPRGDMSGQLDIGCGSMGKFGTRDIRFGVVTTQVALELYVRRVHIECEGGWRKEDP